MPDDHSNLVPLLPIPNRTVKQVCADDSADSRVKVGHRQALTAPNTPSYHRVLGGFGFYDYTDRKCTELPGAQQRVNNPESYIAQSNNKAIGPIQG
jgi:hypothetical protein